MKADDETSTSEQRGTSPAPVSRWVEMAAILISLYFGYQLLLIAWGIARAVLVVILLAVFGALLAYLLLPAVDLLERHGAPRAAGILLVYLLVLGGLGLGISLLADPLGRQIAGALGQLPGYADRAQQWLRGLDAALADAGIRLDLASVFSDRLAALAGSGGIEGTVVAALKGLRRAVESVVYVVIVLVIAFWLAKDGRLLRDRVTQAVPVRYRDRVLFLFDAMGLVVGGYLRAQLLLAVIIGAMAAAGMALLGVHFPLVIGLAAALFELIPMVGPLAGGAVGVTIALFQSPRLALLAAGWFLAIHVVEGYVLAPRVTGRFVRLHPLVAFLALLIGLQAGGFLGALFAVPLASLGKVLLTAVYRDYQAREPELFTGTAPGAGRWRAALQPFLTRRREADARVQLLAFLRGPRARTVLVLGLLLLAAVVLGAGTRWLFLH